MLWKDDYETGIATIDRQHKTLVGMTTILEEATKAYEEMTQETGEILKDLVDYVKVHFRDEEEVMKKISFPEYSRHVELHKELVNEVRDILLVLKNGGRINNAELLVFLQKWLLEHIIIEDKKIGQYLFGNL